MEQATKEEQLELFNKHFALKTSTKYNHHKELKPINVKDFRKEYVWEIANFEKGDYNERDSLQPNNAYAIVMREDLKKLPIQYVENGQDIDDFILNRMTNHINIEWNLKELRFEKKLITFNNNFKVEEVFTEDHYTICSELTNINDLEAKNLQPILEKEIQNNYSISERSGYYISKNEQPLKQILKLSDLEDFINNDMENYL